jgi:hypothetical protein
LKNVSATIKSLDYVDDAGVFMLKKLGIWSKLHPTEAPYLNINAVVFLQMSYYNPRSLAFEPLLERWDFSLGINQLAPYTQQKIMV